MKAKPLHSFFWLWLPIILLIAQILLQAVTPPALQATLHSEGGPHETLQFIFMAIAFVYALRCLHLSIKSKNAFLIFWTTCFTLGCLYIAGEEVSWGQHIFDWATPEFWSGVNDQNETNLHNTSSWLDQKPRLLLLIGVIVGGLIIPLINRIKPQILPSQFKSIYPPAILAVTALMTLAVKITDKIDDALPDTILFYRASEIEEIYLFYFVLLYLVVLRRRLLQQ